MRLSGTEAKALGWEAGQRVRKFIHGPDDFRGRLNRECELDERTRRAITLAAGLPRTPQAPEDRSEYRVYCKACGVLFPTFAMQQSYCLACGRKKHRDLVAKLRRRERELNSSYPRKGEHAQPAGRSAAAAAHHSRVRKLRRKTAPPAPSFTEAL